MKGSPWEGRPVDPFKNSQHLSILSPWLGEGWTELGMQRSQDEGLWGCGACLEGHSGHTPAFASTDTGTLCGHSPRFQGRLESPTRETQGRGVQGVRVAAFQLGVTQCCPVCSLALWPWRGHRQPSSPLPGWSPKKATEKGERGRWTRSEPGKMGPEDSGGHVGWKQAVLTL